MRILHDAGIDQGGFGAAEGASQQLTVLREAAGMTRSVYRTEVETEVDGVQPTDQANSWQCCRESFDVRVLRGAGIGQGGFGAAEGASQQLTVLRDAAGFDMISLQDAGRGQGGWSVANRPSHQLAELLRKFGRGDSA